MEQARSGRVRLRGVRQFDERGAGRIDGRNVVGADDDDVCTMDRHGNRRGDDAAVAVVDRGDIVERQRLALGDEVELAVLNAVGPARRAVVGVAGRLHHAQRHLDGQDRRQLRRRQRRGDVVALCIVIAERIGRGDRRADDGPVGQVDVGEGDGAGHGIDRRIAGADPLRNRAAGR